MNQGITILQDYSAGSNATTMLCMDAEKTFYRKYAFWCGRRQVGRTASLAAQAPSKTACPCSNT